MWFPAEPSPAEPSPAEPSPAEPFPIVVTAWEYGSEMLKRGDVAGALAVLQAVVAHTPNDLVQRGALREIEKRIRTETKVDEQSASLVLMDVSWEIQQAKHKVVIHDARPPILA